MEYLKHRWVVWLLAGVVLGLLLAGTVYADSVWPRPNHSPMHSADMMNMASMQASHQPAMASALFPNGAVALDNSTFVPFTVTVHVGEAVTWTRNNGFHNVHADDNSFRLGENANGDAGGSWGAVSHTFTQAGTFRYYCDIHGGPNGVGMAGVVVVEAASAVNTNVYLPLVLK
ncbi:MAG: plastocyanin/azurin family copper-binding protein [Caldilineaceae bacterium]